MTSYIVMPDGSAYSGSTSRRVSMRGGHAYGTRSTNCIHQDINLLPVAGNGIVTPADTSNSKLIVQLGVGYPPGTLVYTELVNDVGASTLFGVQATDANNRLEITLPESVLTAMAAGSYGRILASITTGGVTNFVSRVFQIEGAGDGNSIVISVPALINPPPNPLTGPSATFQVEPSSPQNPYVELWMFLGTGANQATQQALDHVGSGNGKMLPGVFSATITGIMEDGSGLFLEVTVVAGKPDGSGDPDYTNIKRKLIPYTANTL